MKRIYLIFAVCCLFATAALAQDRPRVFDNFDTSRGVVILIPTVVPVPKAKNKKLVKKTSQTKMVVSVTDGLAQPQAANSEYYKKLLMGSGASMKGFTTGNLLVDSYIVDSSRRYGIDPLLIYAQMHQESSFKLRALSYKGASGLMQLMPATARRMGVTDIYNPKQNIEGGVKYMRWLMDTFNGDLSLALAGYNAGEGAVMKYGWNIPPYRETQEYVRRISARYNSISDPRYVQSAQRIKGTVASRLVQKESRPLTVYEPSPLAIRTADGKMMLVNQ